jgi:mycothiol system anti-sigma-R factor
MTCDEALEFISVYLDGELAVPDIARLQQHLRRCEACRASQDAEAWLSSIIAAGALSEEPPDSLRQRIRERVSADAAALSVARSRRWRRALLPALIGALSAGAGLFLAVRAFGPVGAPPILTDAVAGHWQYSDTDARLEVKGDAHHLEQWLRDHLGMAVRLPADAGRGETPVGARVVRMAGHPAAQVLYTGAGHSISLFVAQKPPRPLPEEGEHIVDGVEVYVTALGASNLGWWQDSRHLYVAVSSDAQEHLLALAERCVRSQRSPRKQSVSATREGRAPSTRASGVSPAPSAG